MKKFAMLLAAGVIALGASAQAASVPSTDTYAVITIPVYAGNNLIGVSVEPLTEGTNLVGLLQGLDPLTQVKTLNADRNAYDEASAGNLRNFAVGNAYWVAGGANTSYIYEVGTQTNAATITAYSGLTIAAGTVPSAWKLSDASLDPATDGANRPSRAPKIHVWDPVNQAYVKYWLSTEGWMAYSDGSDADDVKVKAAQGFFFELPSGSKTFTITPTVQ